MLDFDNGATSKIDDVLSEDVGLLHVLPLAVHLNCQALPQPSPNKVKNLISPKGTGADTKIIGLP